VRNPAVMPMPTQAMMPRRAAVDIGGTFVFMGVIVGQNYCDRRGQPKPRDREWVPHETALMTVHANSPIIM